jgi:hypothetical protein
MMPSSVGTISTRAPIDVCASRTYCMEGKSSADATILFRLLEVKSKHDSTHESAIDALG